MDLHKGDIAKRSKKYYLSSFLLHVFQGHPILAYTAYDLRIDVGHSGLPWRFRDYSGEPSSFPSSR